jgi:hypothetical protein
MSSDQNKLLELYKLAIETDRFELDLAWKSVQFFTVLNSGLLSLAFTLLGSNQLSPKYYVIPIFAIGIVFSILAIQSRKRYHEHSLRASYKKTLIEDQLDLYKPLQGYEYKQHNLAISTSRKKDPVKEILSNPDSYIKQNVLKPWTVPFYHKVIFVIFIVLYGIGILFSIVLAWLNIRF